MDRVFHTASQNAGSEKSSRKFSRPIHGLDRKACSGVSPRYGL
jgi:hypothetical protein